MSINQLGDVYIEASDLAAWEAFGSDILGLQLVSKDNGRLAFRMDQHEQRIVVVKGPADDVSISGWEAESEAALLESVARLKAAGVAVEEGSKELAKERRVERVFSCVDPDGNRLELYYGPAITHEPFRSKVLRSAFVTGAQGLGHCFLIAKKDRKATLDFYVGALGLKVSDYIRQEIAPGIVADAAFLHCNGRHHSLGVAAMPVPKRIHHVLLEVADISDVGRAYDRVNDAGIPLEMTLGMHPNDKMLSFYVRTPSGFAIEFGFGGLQVDDSNWTVKSFDQLSEWGHRPPAQQTAAA